MEADDSNNCGSGCDCRPDDRTAISRRNFLATIALAAMATTVKLPDADGATELKSGSGIPVDKGLSASWIASLTERGSLKKYSGGELERIGMPVGGLCAGQLYLGGDGKLWRWNIFNLPIASPSNGDRYVQPPARDYPVDQGFRLTIEGEKQSSLNLDSSGFARIEFCGQYPVGTVEYTDTDCPVKVQLRAFSPFIPLDFDRSSYPATIMRYTLANMSSAPVKVSLAAWQQNAVCGQSSEAATGQIRNTIVTKSGLSTLSCDLVLPPEHAVTQDVLFENWEKASYANWTVEGTAFGAGPILKSEMPEYQGDVGGDGDRVVNSHATASGDIVERDAATGKLTSQAFVISRRFIRVWVGGGNNPGLTCVNVVCDGDVVVSLTGENNNQMSLRLADLTKYVGKTARIVIVDSATGPWGNIGVGSITFTDSAGDTSRLPDYGTMALTLLGRPADSTSTTGGADNLSPGIAGESISDLSSKLTGCLSRTVELRAGETADIDFIISWYFPNLHLDGLGNVGNYYSTRFSSAADVADSIAKEFNLLCSTTELWRSTWYDSTLPYWFLDRTFANIGVIASTTAFRFNDGRFYSWEGVGCCQGTCTHVWHYAQALARLFPEIERDTRHRVDLGVALDPATGVIGFRAEFDRGLAVDGQAGTILRFYREHQMSTNADFLSSNWTLIKKSFEPLLRLDPNKNGILQGAQMNTLDLPWYGENAWQSSLYVAALRAGQAMATELGDSDFALTCKGIAERGSSNIVDRLFDGEYFYNRVDPAHLDAVNSGTGCHIDQVIGQSWAFQVGLPRILPERETHSALNSLWKYNFAPDVGPFRKANPPGRWYAVAGEAGLVMTTFPRMGWTYENAKGAGPEWATGYFDECMTGFEHQVASHMIYEGLIQEGLAVERAIHDRYHPSKRNPYNEIECGDHYSRSMASYGVYLAACGYGYHGPKQELSFAPRLSPDSARFAFTAAEGWGAYSQQETSTTFHASVEVKHGLLKLRRLKVSPIRKTVVGEAVVALLGGNPINVVRYGSTEQTIVELPTGTVIKAGETLSISFHVVT